MIAKVPFFELFPDGLELFRAEEKVCCKIVSIDAVNHWLVDVLLQLFWLIEGSF